MSDIQLQPGWLDRDVRRAAAVVAKDEVAKVERRIRNLNDELSDACSALKAAKKKLSDLERT